MAGVPRLSPEETEIYRAAARRRHELEQEELARREVRAWEAARRAAVLLRDDFGAERVVVFGSLIVEGLFTPWSDVDIAAWGLRPQDTFRAIGAVMDLDADIEINLVDVNTCSTSMLASIERNNVDL